MYEIFLTFSQFFGFRVGMYQCENGHLICKDCIGRCSNVCPTCKKPMGKIRSIIADKV